MTLSELTRAPCASVESNDMTLKIELQGSGPGNGLLRVGGHFEEPESVALAIQRNDGRYLGAAQVWQTTLHWHPQFGVQPDGLGLRLDVGPDIIDGVIGVGGIPLRVVLRVDGAEDFGVLRIKGELIGTGAAAAVTATGDRQDHADASSDSVATDVDVLGAEMGLDAGIEGAERIPPRRPRVGVWLALVLLLAMLAAFGGGWYLGLFDDWLGIGQAEQEAVGETASVLELTPNGEADLSGVELARSILAGHPASELVYARAEQAEQQGDCAAALVLFNAAADAEPRYAATLARRYDLQTFDPGGCIEQPDAPYAIVFFTDAARAGDVAAQRRLGQLMIERERSGPTYEEGLEWLRKASESGDEDAGRSLKELGL